MAKKNTKRELTYNEAKALLQNLYSSGDSEQAQELWGSVKENTKQDNNSADNEVPEQNSENN